MQIDVIQALREIDDMAPVYRREYAMEFVRKHLSVEDAKKILFMKDKWGYFDKMDEAGYVDSDDLVKKIGKDRVREFFKRTDRRRG